MPVEASWEENDDKTGHLTLFFEIQGQGGFSPMIIYAFIFDLSLKETVKYEIKSWVITLSSNMLVFGIDVNILHFIIYLHGW